MNSECQIFVSSIKSRNEPSLTLHQKETVSNLQITVFNEIPADEQQCPLNRISLIDDPSLVSIQEMEEPKLYPFSHGEKTCLFLRFFFFHQTYYSYFLKKNVLDKRLKIEEKHLPKLSAAEDIANTIAVTQNAIKQKGFISCCDLIKMVFFGELKVLTCICFAAYAMESISKSGISLVISELINEVENGQQPFILGIGLCLLNLTCIICRHHGQNYAMTFSSKARMTLINLVFIKLTQQSTFSIKQANIGKILNLISGDINYLENEFIVIFQSSVVLITIILGCYILWYRFSGVIGLLALVIIFTAYPIQMLLQSFNSETLKQAKFFQDQRLKLTNELIEGIRLVKMYAWEKAFQQMIILARSKEFMHYLKISLRMAVDRLFSILSQVWASYIFFVILYYGGYREKMSVAEMISTIQFLSFFKQRCVFIVSQGIKAIITVKVSFERITNVINMENCDMKQIQTVEEEQMSKESDHSPIIQLNNFSSYWTSDVTDETKPMLKNITLSINEGESWAFIGRIGCGKSTLINALLFEIPAYKGSIKINGKEADKGELKIAYVEQEPFIFPDTIRNNIIFGRSFNKILYQKVLHASQLETDLNLMKFQDHTEIGERGTTLSGGQKARISLARALYQQADLYLFDDPLSAVDSHVAKNIFHMAIQEFIFEEQIKMNPHKQKPIVILATHQIQFAIKFDKIAILNEGELIATGSYEEIKTKLNMINEELAKQLNLSNESQKFIRPIFSKRTKIISKKNHNLTGKEADQQEQVTLKTYFRYAKNQSLFAILFVLSFQIASEVITNLYQRIIALFQDFQNQGEIDYAYSILGLFLLCLFFLNFLKYLINTVSIQKSVQKMHEKMLIRVTSAPASYFDVNPSGRIINRFSNDISLCDNLTNQVTMDIIETIGNFFISLITLSILQKYFIIPIVFVLIINFYQFSYAKNVISQLRELELMARSPLFDFLKKTVSGVTQMRVYEKQEWFRQQFFDLANKCNLISLTYYYATRCFAFNVDLIGFLAQTAGIFIFISFASDSLAIFSQGILLLINYNDTLQFGLLRVVTFQTVMNSYNRIFQIIDISHEAPHVKKEDEQQIDFPKNGDITFKNVHMRYRQNTDLVLKGLSFKIKSGEKIGCVGRTGSGKSSILQAIFRMAEIEQDDNCKIEIGNINIKTLGLHKLRNSIGIIPQSPFLFTGSIRRNLDPFDQYDDQTLWKSLEDTDLIQYVKELKKGLLTDMSDVNSIFSVGQKQLICLARVILQQKRIIVLDEATANVDMKTDDFIQDTLKRKFNDCTLITIAHRLNTIADYDKVMVINDGKVLEYDQPFNLLAQSIESNEIDKITEFSKLVKNTGDQNAQAIFDIAKQRICQKIE